MKAGVKVTKPNSMIFMRHKVNQKELFESETFRE